MGPSLHNTFEEARILVVDDEQFILDMVSATLENENYKVVLYSPGASDESVLRDRFDVVILDVFMPYANGFAIREEVLKYSPKAQFIFITGLPDKNLLDKITSLGAYGFLIKPFTCDQIKFSVMGALRMQKLVVVKDRTDDAEATGRIDLPGALRRIDAIINSMGEGVLAIDNTTAVVLMNGVAEKITGVRFGECAGVCIEQCNAKKEVKEYLLRLITDNNAPNINRLLKTENEKGEHSFYSVNIQDVVDSSGKRTGSVIIFQDRTEAYNMVRFREAFLNVAAHELRTPLTVIMNYLGILEKEGNDLDTRNNAINDMLSSSRRMKYIVNSIINFINLSSSSFSASASSVDIAEIIRKEINMLENDANEKKIAFELNASPAVPCLFADPDLIAIAINNILNNAVGFSKEHGQVTVNLQDKNIKGGKIISIEVFYEGHGNFPPITDDYFEGFGLVDIRQNKIYFGLENGLYPANRAAKLLGGSLHSEEPEKNKIRIVLELPCERTSYLTK